MELLGKASGTEVEKILDAARPGETALHTGIAEWHHGAAIVEEINEKHPDVNTLKRAAPHFKKAAKELMRAREQFTKTKQSAVKIEGNKAFIMRMDDLLVLLDLLATESETIAKQLTDGKLPDAEAVYQASAGLTKIAIRLQENTHRRRIIMSKMKTKD